MSNYVPLYARRRAARHYAWKSVRDTVKCAAGCIGFGVTFFSVIQLTCLLVETLWG